MGRAGSDAVALSAFAFAMHSAPAPLAAHARHHVASHQIVAPRVLCQSLAALTQNSETALSRSAYSCSKYSLRRGCVR